MDLCLLLLRVEERQALEIQASSISTLGFMNVKASGLPPNPWLHSLIVSEVSFSLDCMWIAHLPLPAYITSNGHLCRSLSLY